MTKKRKVGLMVISEFLSHCFGLLEITSAVQGNSTLAVCGSSLLHVFVTFEMALCL